ncbi:SagB/ThcOx family dehydrogenase [Candidatus Saganbacteria bacterium]|nr:SagB/ThcOx family dehydrogenase [Candidatus Saganbacteria bacterium]
MLKRSLALLLILIFSGSFVFAAKIIPLPPVNTNSHFSLEEAIARRRSETQLQEKSLTMNQISQLLWAAQGITDPTFGFRAAPSAGALYPLSIYVAKQDGLFRYIPDGHKLIQISDQDIRPSMTRAALSQDFIREAPVDIIITANFAITQAKYGARSFRYVCMEAGHVAENIQLQAVALGLVSVPVGAFWDDVIRTNLKLPETQDPLYIIPIGYLKS